MFYGCYQFRVWVWITPDSSLDVVSWQPTHIVVLEFYLECNYVSRAIPVPSTHSQHEKCALQQFHAVTAVTAETPSILSERRQQLCPVYCGEFLFRIGGRPAPLLHWRLKWRSRRGSVLRSRHLAADAPSLLSSSLQPRRKSAHCNLMKSAEGRHLSVVIQTSYARCWK